MQCIVLHKFFEHRTVFLILSRSIILCIYLFAEVLVQSSFSDVSIALEHYLSLALSATDHIVHPALIDKLVIICESKVRGQGLAVVHGKGQRYDLLTISIMSP